MGSDPYGGYEGYLTSLGLYTEEQKKSIGCFIEALKCEKISIENNEHQRGWNKALQHMINIYEESLKVDEQQRKKHEIIYNRCPKCNSDEINMDIDSSKIRCRKCGYNQINN